MDHQHLNWIDTQAATMQRLVVDWANINSGSHHLEGLSRMLAALEAEFSSLGGEMKRVGLAAAEDVDARGEIVRSPVGDALVIAKRPDAPVRVFLGIHYDTVYGPEHPFQLGRVSGDRALGPGVIDAKGGIVVMLTALRALERSPFAHKIGWEVLLNSDEEVGSPGSAPLLRDAAKRNHLGLVFEPAMSDGSLVSERKGSGNFTAIVRGKASHAGRDFANGRNAIVAAADLVARIDAIGAEGMTINCGRIAGGGATNIVPDLCIVRFNVRVMTREQQALVDGRIREAASHVGRRDGITVEVHGGFSSPPKALDARSSKLLNAVIACGRDIGLPLCGIPSGGTCDGNKLAAAGLPVVDSLGPVGGELHSDREWLHLPSLTERAKLTALLLMKLAAGEIQVP